MSKQVFFLTVVFFVNFFALASSADVSLYDNSINTGSWYRPSLGGFSEVCDYGRAVAGTVTKFRFAYVTTASNPGNIVVPPVGRDIARPSPPTLGRSPVSNTHLYG